MSSMSFIWRRIVFTAALSDVVSCDSISIFRHSFDVIVIFARSVEIVSGASALRIRSFSCFCLCISIVDLSI